MIFGLLGSGEKKRRNLTNPTRTNIKQIIQGWTLNIFGVTMNIHLQYNSCDIRNLLAELYYKIYILYILYASIVVCMQYAHKLFYKGTYMLSCIRKWHESIVLMQAFLDHQFHFWCSLGVLWIEINKRSANTMSSYNHLDVSNKHI